MGWEKVLFVGDAAHEEFREAWAWLARRYHGIRVVSAADARQELHIGESPPDLIVFAQARPGEFSQSQIEQLHRAAPLARLVALLGSWCEGEVCGGRAWSGVPRIYWHEFASRMDREYADQRTRAKSWSLPRTATDAERLALECLPLPASQHGLVAVAAANRIAYEGLAEACAQAGYATAWVLAPHQGHLQSVVAGIWDDSSDTAHHPLELAAFTREICPAPVVALVHFPRRADWDRALAAGASAVHAKPFVLDDLLANLARLASQPGGKQEPAHAA